jgi:hypothetical protein
MNFSLPHIRRSEDAFHAFDNRSYAARLRGSDAAADEPINLTTLNVALAVLEHEDRRVFEVVQREPCDLPTLQQLVDDVLHGKGKAPPAVIYLPMSES